MFDEHKVCGPTLELWVADVDDDGSVGEHGDNNDNDDYEAL